MSQAANHNAQHVYTTRMFQSPRRRTTPVLVSGMRGLANPKQRLPDEDLRINDVQLDRLLETTKIVVWEAEAEDWRFTYVSEQAQKILGYPIADWYEPNFLSRPSPSGRQTPESFNFDSTIIAISLFGCFPVMARSFGSTI